MRKCKILAIRETKTI